MASCNLGYHTGAQIKKCYLNKGLYNFWLIKQNLVTVPLAGTVTSTIIKEVLYKNFEHLLTAYHKQLDW